MFIIFDDYMDIFKYLSWIPNTVNINRYNLHNKKNSKFRVHNNS